MFAPDQVEAMHRRLTDVGASLGVPFTPRPHAPSTKPALLLSEFAREQGRLDAWREAAMNAHWRDGLDIEDRTVLDQLLAATGLDASAGWAFVDRPDAPRLLHRQRAEAMQWGVSGIPTWFLLPPGWSLGDARPPDGEPQPIRVVGCQPMEVVLAAAERAGAALR